MAFIKGAKMAGAHVVEGVSVSSVTTTTATETKRGGNIANCAGMWARQLGQRSCSGTTGTGVTVPNQAAEHYYDYMYG
jgi:glycine/D-amino acid oxidase-like deaminating enzyme